jgi:hypothetical protein
MPHDATRRLAPQRSIDPQRERCIPTNAGSCVAMTGRFCPILLTVVGGSYQRAYAS